jgi:hypothetical protein
MNIMSITKTCNECNIVTKHTYLYKSYKMITKDGRHQEPFTLAYNRNPINIENNRYIVAEKQFRSSNFLSLYLFIIFWKGQC